MSASKALLGALQKQVLVLEDDLRSRVESEAATRAAWVGEHEAAVSRGRTAASWQAWRDDRVTQAAVGWVLTSVFVRFCEDNRLVEPVWTTGAGDRRQRSLDAELEFYRARSREQQDVTARDWLLEAFRYLGSLPATAALVDEHAPLWLVQPSGDAASALLGFWRERGEDGALVHDFTDPSLDTRFLGDLYQDLSQHAKDTYALLQTPEFVEEFILDRTLEPALAERPLEGLRLIDPTCGSGHFLLGAFDRLLDRWQRQAPGMERQALVQQALDSIHGVDINPFAVAIARFRLTVTALKASGLRSLESAPAFRFHLAVGDSLLHGPGQQTLQNDTDLSGFTYTTEDLGLLQEILTDGRYDVVVGNPPYITVKDPQLNQAYRERYKTCKGTYALTVPFMERFFGLARYGREGQLAGWVGQITSNSFMKREFGSKLIEDFLRRKDLRLLADTSGAFIPGHGTPTVILVGRNQPLVGPTVRAALGIRGEPARPSEPEKGRVWRSIVEHVDEPGWDDGWITIAELDRELLATHPWSLSGGGAVALLAKLNGGRTRLADRGVEIGRTTHTGNDEAFFVTSAAARTFGLGGSVVPIVLGEDVRDFEVRPALRVILPYDRTGSPVELAEPALRHLWRTRRSLETQLDFQRTKAQRGLRWVDHSMFFAKRYRTPLSLAFAFVSTHNHFALDRGGKVFKQSAPVVKLRDGAGEDEYLGLLGVLSSSLACFWLKQNSHSKGNEGYQSGIKSENWERFWEFTGTTLADFPLSARLAVQRGRQLDTLAHEAASFEPAAVVVARLPGVDDLSQAGAESARVRGLMVAVQEELDWEIYRLYGLIDEDLTYAGDDLPDLELGERAFEVALARRVVAGEEETAWFLRHGSTPIIELPTHWPVAYRDLVQRRLELIESDSNIRLLERPENKRRWASESWEKRQTAALRDWLLDRLEDRRFWFDRQGSPSPRSVAQLADEVARDPDMVSVLAMWEGRPDVPVVQSLTKLLADEAVPFLAAYRYKDSGLRKREAWEHTWALQRREDAGERIENIPVPPKYTSADFRKTSYWQARGKLDVPKERFILYPEAGRETDPTPLLGWAGWDHAQQSLALSVIIGTRESEGWADERLVPLVAGLAELQPWVEQWHAEIDPAFGLSLAAFCREQLTTRAGQVAKTTDELAAWRPTPPTRGRKPRNE
jgi:uncharacterized protein DUF7008/Eco57I restriction-modification methylase